MGLPLTNEITLDLTPGKVMPIVNVSQFDQGRLVKVNLTNNGVPYIVKNTDSFEIKVSKPDGTIVTASCGPGSVPGQVYTYIYFTTTTQMAAVPGDSVCEIKVIDSEDTPTINTIGTLNFIMRVERDPIDGGVQSASAIHDLQEQVNNDVLDALEGLSLGDLGDVEIVNPHSGDTLKRDSNGKWVNSHGDLYEEITAPAGATSFTVTFSNMTNRKKVYVYRDSYTSAPPTNVTDSYNSSTNELTVTVTFEAEETISNWLVGVI